MIVKVGDRIRIKKRFDAVLPAGTIVTVTKVGSFSRLDSSMSFETDGGAKYSGWTCPDEWFEMAEPPLTQEEVDKAQDMKKVNVDDILHFFDGK